jgi:hypothetical protein
MAEDGKERARGNSANVDRRGGAGPRAIGETAVRLTRRSLGKRGFVEAALVAEWPVIVGSMLSTDTMPLKIRFPRGERSGGVLLLRCGSGTTATLVQHQEPFLVERINSYFGYGAVARLSISQGPVPKRQERRRPAPPALSRNQEEDLARTVDGVEDPGVREALAALGRHLVRKPR